MSTQSRLHPQLHSAVGGPRGAAPFARSPRSGGRVLGALLLALLLAGCSILLPESVPDPTPAPTLRIMPPTGGTRVASAIQTPTAPPPSPTPEGREPPATPPGPGPGPTALATPGGAHAAPESRVVDPATVIGEPVTITFWHHLAPETLPGALLAGALAEFQRTYTEVTVEAMYQRDADLRHRQILLAIEEGSAPDLAVGSPQAIAEYVRRGAAAPLDPHFEDPAVGLTPDDLGDLLPGPLESGNCARYGGHYAFPFTPHALALWVNRDLLAAAGHDAPPTTPDEFAAAARAVRERTGAAGYILDGSGTALVGWLLADGAGVLSEDHRTAQFDSDAGARALGRLAELRATGAAIHLDASTARREFARGNVAMLVDSTGSAGEMRRLLLAEGAVERPEMVPLPQGEGGRGTALLGDALVVLSASPERQRAAWLLVRFLTDRERATRWARAGYVPLRQSAIEALAGGGSPSPMGEIARRAVPEPAVPCGQEIRDYLSEALRSATEGLLAPEEALGHAARHVNGILAAGCK